MTTATPQKLIIGGFLYNEIDQADFTGAFEVLARLPGAEFLSIAHTLETVRDVKGLVLTPNATFATAPQVDVLVVPGGGGVNELMEDAETLDFLKRQAAGAQLVLSICTGALLLGAAGLLRKRHVTTHWNSHRFLKEFGAVPIDSRVVVDGKLVSAAGVTSSFDGALWAARQLCGDQVAQEIQLYLEYAPCPPFASGSPATAPAEITAAVQDSMRKLTSEREAVVARVAQKLEQARLTTARK